jgi:hypothetical protein
LVLKNDLEYTSDLIKDHEVFVKLFGKPKTEKGLSITEINKEDYQNLPIKNLPVIQWDVGNTILVHGLTDHWGIFVYTSLMPKSRWKILLCRIMQ